MFPIRGSERLDQSAQRGHSARRGFWGWSVPNPRPGLECLGFRDDPAPDRASGRTGQSWRQPWRVPCPSPAPHVQTAGLCGSEESGCSAGDRFAFVACKESLSPRETRHLDSGVWPPHRAVAQRCPVTAKQGTRAQLALRSSGALATQARRPPWRRSTLRHRSAGSGLNTSPVSAGSTIHAPSASSPSSCIAPHPE